MPLPAWLGRFNRRVTNPLARPVAERLPGFAVVLHRGRRSGHRYRTPVNAFAVPGGFLVALTYGSDADWVENVLSAGGCSLLHRGRIIEMAAPRILPLRRHRAELPGPVRPMLGMLKVEEVLRLDLFTEVSSA